MQTCQSELHSRFLGRCGRKATVSRDGKHYCWQHDPERRIRAAAERREAEKARAAKRDAEWDSRDARRLLERQAGITDLSDEELRAIAGLGGIRAMIQAASAMAKM